jgi:hypothetical protein
VVKTKGLIPYADPIVDFVKFYSILTARIGKTHVAKYATPIMRLAGLEGS